MEIGGTVFNRDLTITSKYVYLFQRDPSIKFYSVQVFDKDFNQTIGRVIFDNTATSSSQDEDGLYITVNTSSSSFKSAYNMTKFTREGSLAWSVPLSNCDDSRFYALGSFPYVIAFCENIVYQLNSVELVEL